MDSKIARVLVSHVDPEKRSGLSRLCSGWGYAVQEATHGIETVVFAQAWEPHVIVADYSLGNMSITEVADRLERSTVHHAIVVLGSELASYEQQNDSRFYAYLRNPSDTQQLRHFVDTAAVDAQQTRQEEKAKLPVSDIIGEVLFEVKFGMTVGQVEQLLIEQTLRHLPNKTHAAEVLGISLKTLHNKVTEYRLKRA
jgi:DNA-binding NtrC family response regulator